MMNPTPMEKVPPFLGNSLLVELVPRPMNRSKLPACGSGKTGNVVEVNKALCFVLFVFYLIPVLR